MWRTNICSFLKYRGLQIREKSQFRITISVLFGWSICVWCYCIERREITVLPWIHWLSSWSTKFLNGIMLCKIIKNHLVPVQCWTLQHLRLPQLSSLIKMIRNQMNFGMHSQFQDWVELQCEILPQYRRVKCFEKLCNVVM